MLTFHGCYATVTKKRKEKSHCSAEIGSFLRDTHSDSGVPLLIPGLLLHPEEGDDLEAQADEDLGHYGKEQRRRDEA